MVENLVLLKLYLREDEILLLLFLLVFLNFKVKSMLSLRELFGIFFLRYGVLLFYV